MKKLKVLLSMLLIALLMLASSGCYMIQGQKMKEVKGTYELTNYTRTNGKTNNVTDYITEYGYKVYLVVTGSGQGYCVFSNNETAPYYYNCSLSYTYKQEDSSIVEYVVYTYNGKTQKFGVTKSSLNFSRPAIKLSETIASDGLSLTWKRVNKATDLSYVEQVFGGSLPLYTAPSDSSQS